MVSELRSATMVPWLPRRIKDALARLAVPFVRKYLAGIPSVRVREMVWNRLVGPHLWWRDFDFTARTSFGMKIVGNTSDPIQKFICYFGVWEPNLTAWIAERLRPGDVFVDVGANIGYFSLLASKLVGEKGRVVAIEASPEVFGLLRRNLELNATRNVRAVNVAISDREGCVQLYSAPGHDSGRTTAAQSWAEEQHFTASSKVRAFPLPAVLHEEEIRAARVIKIDVEGYEWQVVSGMAEMLKACRPDVEIMVEVTPLVLRAQGKSCEDLLRIFAPLGFDAYRINNDYSPMRYLSSKRPDRPLRVRDSNLTDQEDLIFSRVDADSIQEKDHLRQTNA